MREFVLPDLGEGLEEAELIEWHVAPGDRVVADQPLATVETDKAVVEVPAPWSGTVAELLAAPGDLLRVGAPLVRFGDTGRADAGAIVGTLEGGPPPGAQAAGGPPEAASGPAGHAPGGTPPAAPPATAPRVASGPGAEPAPATGAGRRGKAAAGTGPQTPSAAGGKAPPGPDGGAAAPAGMPAPRAMPAARALAAREGVDLAAVAGTGPRGVVTRADVERHLDAGPAGAGWTALSGARRAMARRMAEAGQVVAATVQDEADVTPWIRPEADILLRLVRACAAAVVAEPALNAWFDAGRLAVRRHDALRLGIAVDTAEGLYVPVLDVPAGADAAALRPRIDALAEAARARRLGRGEQSGATFTLSNFGPIGGRHAALVVAPPQVGILGAGRACETAGWAGGAPVRRVALPLSLSFDHRAVTGGEAARFLSAAIADLELPD